eukprot:5709445-Pyramimonas_sp.AAC.1
MRTPPGLGSAALVVAGDRERACVDRGPQAAGANYAGNETPALLHLIRHEADREAMRNRQNGMMRCTLAPTFSS